MPRYKLAVETVYGQEVTAMELETQSELTHARVVCPGFSDPAFADLRMKLRDMGVDEEADISPLSLLMFSFKRLEG